MLKAVAVLPHSLRYVVRGDSMAPAFQRGQHLLAERATASSPPPARGDVLVVQHPGGPGETLLKRVVGLPGERVTLDDGLLYLDGVRLAEPYLRGMPASPGPGRAEWRLAADEYIVLGDNRAHSTDSRAFGPTGLHHVVAKVWFRYWPPASWGRVG